MDDLGSLGTISIRRSRPPDVPELRTPDRTERTSRASPSPEPHAAQAVVPAASLGKAEAVRQTPMGQAGTSHAWPQWLVVVAAFGGFLWYLVSSEPTRLHQLDVGDPQHHRGPH